MSNVDSRQAAVGCARQIDILTSSTSICMLMPARGRTSSHRRLRGQVCGPSHHRAACDRACRRRTAHSHRTNYTRHRIQYFQLRASPAACVSSCACPRRGESCLQEQALSAGALTVPTTVVDVSPSPSLSAPCQQAFARACTQLVNALTRVASRLNGWHKNHTRASHWRTHEKAAPTPLCIGVPRAHQRRPL